MQILHIRYSLILLLLHINFDTRYCGKEKKYMFIKSIFEGFNYINYDHYNNKFDKVDPNLIRYFRTEYGSDWKIALEYHLYNKSLKKEKKVA